MEIIDQAIKFGHRHCCACASTCNHIGPIHLCAMHERMESKSEPRPPTSNRRDPHQPREATNQQSERGTMSKTIEISDELTDTPGPQTDRGIER